MCPHACIYCSSLEVVADLFERTLAARALAAFAALAETINDYVAVEVVEG